MLCYGAEIRKANSISENPGFCLGTALKVNYTYFLHEMNTDDIFFYFTPFFCEL